ncbi:insulin-like growth factor-binding protein 2 [Ylistrum balloti]|uniref:insulin-like growth factor-binding protein 2 n=1 Tax=Ylistrum balloti TaxID=509963 RepID=UPI002905E40B|nr:insulin-like growth factor-binding protein 2 [Ylistrum balloti]
MLPVIVVLVASLGYASAIVCTPELCKGVDRETPLNCAGSIIRNGGFCGCSDVCAKVEGEACQATYMFGIIPAGRCDDGLECVHDTTEHSRLGVGSCQRKQDSVRSFEGHAQTTCEQMRAVQQISFVIYSGQWMAKCDAMGNFEPEQCDNENKCFCVDQKSGHLLSERQLGHVACSGRLLFLNTWSYSIPLASRDVAKRAATPCQLARSHAMLSMVVYDGQWFPNCDAQGKYLPRQCDNQHKCFCVDTLSGKLLTDRELGDVQC